MPLLMHHYKWCCFVAARQNADHTQWSYGLGCQLSCNHTFVCTDMIRGEGSTKEQIKNKQTKLTNNMFLQAAQTPGVDAFHIVASRPTAPLAVL